MLFLNREAELHAPAPVADDRGGLAVVWGRRRVGKTRLLLEWCTRAKGLYTTADQSSAARLGATTRRTEPGWDLVADAVQGPRTLLGESWFSRTPVRGRRAARGRAPSVSRRATASDWT